MCPAAGPKPLHLPFPEASILRTQQQVPRVCVGPTDALLVPSHSILAFPPLGWGLAAQVPLFPPLDVDVLA